MASSPGPNQPIKGPLTRRRQRGTPGGTERMQLMEPTNFRGRGPLLWAALACMAFLAVPGAAIAAKACKGAAAGMVCIPGGSIDRPNFGNKRRASAMFKASVETFYIDKTEVSNSDYARCVKEGGCYYPWQYRPQRRFSRPNQPMVNVDWYDALRYCTWAGKRLPTEAEWERASRRSSGDTYPWGNAKPSCKLTHTSGCGPRRAKNVTQGSAHGHGLYHMAGNVMEWVADWYQPCIKGCNKACGSACTGKNPRGVCNGNLNCVQAWKRVAKGGSWIHSRQHLKPTWRTGLKPSTRSNALGFRCASSRAKVRPPKGYVHMQTRPTVAMPTRPLSPRMSKLFRGFPVDVLKTKKLCSKAGRSYNYCRDPNHYVLSNERRQFLWRPFLQNLGGAHVGIGADQNYNFIAWSRSQVAWLMDYDHVIVWIHQLHRAFILKSPRAEAYLEYWKPKNAKKSMKLLRKMYAKDTHRKMILRAYDRYRSKIMGSFQRDLRFLKKNKKSKRLRHYWLFNPKHYKYIRTLYQLKRIRLMPGDLLKHKSLKGAAQAAKKMGLTVRTCYLSNAEEVWLFPPTYRKYFRTMPFDKVSILIRTGSLSRWRTKKYGWFHYNLQGALDYQRKINARAPKGYSYMGFRYNGARFLMQYFRHRSPIREDLTLINLPRTY